MKKINTIVAIVAITILEGIALYKGFDGQTLSVVIGLVAGLGGYAIGQAKK